jgi:hypothetical protein
MSFLIVTCYIVSILIFMICLMFIFASWQTHKDMIKGSSKDFKINKISGKNFIKILKNNLDKFDVSIIFSNSLFYKKELQKSFFDYDDYYIHAHIFIIDKEKYLINNPFGFIKVLYFIKKVRSLKFKNNEIRKEYCV